MTPYAAAPAVTWEGIGNFLTGFADNLLAVGVLLAVAWKILKPHLVAFVRASQANQAAALSQLEDDEKSDTLASRAKAAAAATADLPKMRERLDVLAGRLERFEDQRVVERLELVEVTQDRHGERIVNLEQVLIKDLANQLRAERAEAWAADPLARSDQARADRIAARHHRGRSADEPVED